jgi:hypothetical protein
MPAYTSKIVRQNSWWYCLSSYAPYDNFLVIDMVDTESLVAKAAAEFLTASFCRFAFATCSFKTK